MQRLQLPIFIRLVYALLVSPVPWILLCTKLVHTNTIEFLYFDYRRSKQVRRIMIKLYFTNLFYFNYFLESKSLWAHLKIVYARRPLFSVHKPSGQIFCWVEFQYPNRNLSEHQDLCLTRTTNMFSNDQSLCSQIDVSPIQTSLKWGIATFFLR